MEHIHTTRPKKRAVALLLLVLFAFPFVSRAATAPPSAGFAQGSIWMSRSHVIAGESVNIFTVLYNSSDNSLSGDVVFAVDGASIGTKDFKLAPGETQIVSAPWVAKAGNHTASARIEKAGASSGTAVLNQTTGNITVSVEASPPPSPVAQVLNTVTSAIQTGVASTAPAVVSAAHSIFNVTEALRADAKTALEKQLAKGAGTADAKQVKEGVAQNQSTGATASTTSADTESSVISNALRYMAAAGLAVVSSRTLFYLAFALMLFVLVKIVRAFFRAGKRREWSD